MSKHTISTCQHCGQEMHPTDYHARLQAINTELLEALQACLERIKTDYPDERDGPGSSPRNPGLIREVKDLAEAVIAKATS